MLLEEQVKDGLFLDFVRILEVYELHYALANSHWGLHDLPA